MTIPFSVRESLRGKHVLVTGATGFLGKVWVALLLDRVPDVGRVTLLARGDGDGSASRRVEKFFATSPAFRALREKHGGAAGLAAFLEGKLDVVRGDVTEPLCGVAPAAAEDLGRTLDIVVHFAGLTDFEPDPARAIAINVRGSAHAADLAALARRARFVHVSTCFVAGNVSGDVPEAVRATTPTGQPFDVEAELATLTARVADAEAKSQSRARKHLARARATAGTERARELGFPNFYTLSKAMGERLLAARRDIALTIVRPSIVECALAYPFAGWNEGINTSAPLVWLLQTAFRDFPCRESVRFDVVPVDTVAKGLCTIVAATVRDGADGVYQIGSSDVNPFTLGRALELTALGARKHHERPEASRLERLVIKHLDAVAVGVDHDGPLALPQLKRLAKEAKRIVGETKLKDVLPSAIQGLWGEALAKRQFELHMKLTVADVALGRVERMLELFQPFVHDNDWCFRSDRFRALDGSLSAEERALFGSDVRTLDWRRYWLDVEWPGLAKWCLPLISGEHPPDDPAPEPLPRFARERGAEPHATEARA